MSQEPTSPRISSVMGPTAKSVPKFSLIQRIRIDQFFQSMGISKHQTR